MWTKITFFVIVISFSLGSESEKDGRDINSKSKCYITTEHFQNKVGRFDLLYSWLGDDHIRCVLQVFNVRRTVPGREQGVPLPLLPPGLQQHLHGQGEERDETGGKMSEKWSLQLQERNYSTRSSGLLTTANNSSNYFYDGLSAKNIYSFSLISSYGVLLSIY